MLGPLSSSCSKSVEFTWIVKNSRSPQATIDSSQIVVKNHLGQPTGLFQVVNVQEPFTLSKGSAKVLKIRIDNSVDRGTIEVTARDKFDSSIATTSFELKGILEAAQPAEIQVTSGRGEIRNGNGHPVLDNKFTVANAGELPLIISSFGFHKSWNQGERELTRYIRDNNGRIAVKISASSDYDADRVVILGGESVSFGMTVNEGMIRSIYDGSLTTDVYLKSNDARDPGFQVPVKFGDTNDWMYTVNDAPLTFARTNDTARNVQPTVPSNAVAPILSPIDILLQSQSDGSAVTPDNDLQTFDEEEQGHEHTSDEFFAAFEEQKLTL